MKFRWWRLAVVAGAILGLTTAGSAAIVPKGKPSPAWSGKTVQGQPINSTQFKGKVVLLNFFSFY